MDALECLSYSLHVLSITGIGRERPKFAAKSMDATQNGQTHDEEDFGTGTIKVDRTKDAAPSLRYI